MLQSLPAVSDLAWPFRPRLHASTGGIRRQRKATAGSLLPMRFYGVVDPLLNRACVEAIVVVVAAAVLAAVADVGDESLGWAAGPPLQENATA